MVCIQNPQMQPDGSVLETVQITNERAVSFNVTPGIDGDGMIAAHTTSGDLLASLRQAAATSNLSVPFYPLVGHSTLTSDQVRLAPGAKLEIQLSRGGSDFSEYIALRGMDLAAVFVKLTSGGDLGAQLDGDPLLGAAVADRLIGALNNGGFDLASATDRFQRGDVSGAFEDIMNALSEAPEVFADTLGLDADAVQALAKDTARVLGALDVLPYAADLTVGPAHGTVRLTGPQSFVWRAEWFSGNGDLRAYCVRWARRQYMAGPGRRPVTPPAHHDRISISPVFRATLV